MKKVLFIMLVSGLLLTACGNEEPKDEDAMGEEDVMSQSAEFTEAQSESNTSNDPLEVASKTNDIDTFETDYYETYTIVDRYVTDDTDQEGFSEMDFEGYKVKFSMAAVEDSSGNEYIGFFTETENTTDKPVHYNGDMEIVTDTQDQTTNEDGIGGSKPGVKLKGFSVAPLEYGIPESYTVTFEPPFLAEDENLPEAGHFGDNIEMEFNKE